jgi:hypothetical protein
MDRVPLPAPRGRERDLTQEHFLRTSLALLALFNLTAQATRQVLGTH